MTGNAWDNWSRQLQADGCKEAVRLGYRALDSYQSAVGGIWQERPQAMVNLLECLMHLAESRKSEPGVDPIDMEAAWRQARRNFKEARKGL